MLATKLLKLSQGHEHGQLPPPRHDSPPPRGLKCETVAKSSLGESDPCNFHKPEAPKPQVLAGVATSQPHNRTNEQPNKRTSEQSNNQTNSQTNDRTAEQPHNLTTSQPHNLVTS